MSHCVMAPAQVCQTQFPRRLQGRRPSGKGRVKSAFQLRGKKGGGGGEREEEKQTRSVCRRHKAWYTKGAREGRRGLPGARLIPTPARGLGEECGRRIPLLGPVGESFPRPGWVRNSAAPHPDGGLGKPPQQGEEELVRGRCALHPSLSAIHPHASPRDAFGAFSIPEAELAAPDFPPPQPGHPSRGLLERPTCDPRPRGSTGVPPGRSYLSSAPGPTPAPRLPPPTPLQLSRSPPGTARRPRKAASKPAPEGRGEKGEAGSQACPVLRTPPDIPHGALPGHLDPKEPGNSFSSTPPPRADPPSWTAPAGARARQWST